MRKDIFLRKDDIVNWIEEERSKSFICRELNCRPDTLRCWLLRFGIEYKGKQGWSKGKKFSKKSAMYYINNNVMISAYKLKNKLIDEGIKKRICEKCNNVEWNGLPISLELHHVNGDRYNNKLNNIMLLCPNCHAQSETYRGKNTSKSIFNNKKYDYLDGEIKKLNPINYTESSINEYKKPVKIKFVELKIKKKKQRNFCRCGKEIKKNSKTCEKCSHLKQRKVERPSYEQLLKEIEESNKVQVGKKYGVSDNAIRNWIKQYKKENTEMVEMVDTID